MHVLLHTGRAIYRQSFALLLSHEATACYAEPLRLLRCMYPLAVYAYAPCGVCLSLTCPPFTVLQT